MLIKVADDRTKRLKLLEELQKVEHLNFPQRDWLRQQLRCLSPGSAKAREAAHYLDVVFAASNNHAVLHDLRLEAGGQIAHIDHLVLDQSLTFFLVETKNYKGSLHIDGRGGFMVEYPGDPISAIESPLEQIRSHEAVLKKVLESLGIIEQAGTQPNFVHLVMVHPKSMIHRADPKAFDSSMVIKADQFSTWHKAYAGKVKAAEVSTDLLGGSSENSVKVWGEQLKAEHRPVNQLDLPDFMKPVALAEKPKAAVPQVCAICGKKLSPKVAKFCADKLIRFNGRLYCYEHQADKK
ncbi:MAG: nuclease-related domain-containing protein [Betaproteobacteria bacterium]